MQLTNTFVGRGFKTSTVAPQTQSSTNASRQVTCMVKKKGIRLIVTLECTEAKGEGATPSRYTTQKVRQTIHLSIDAISQHFKLFIELPTSLTDHRSLAALANFHSL